MAIKIVLGLVIILSVGAQGTSLYSGTSPTPRTSTIPSTPAAPRTPRAPPTPMTPAIPPPPSNPGAPQSIKYPPPVQYNPPVQNNPPVKHDPQVKYPVPNENQVYDHPPYPPNPYTPNKHQLKPKCKVYYASWREWGHCSRTCGSGFQSRYRYCIPQKSYNCTPPEHYSCKNLGPSYEGRECYEKSCCPDVDGHWHFWGCWSYCLNGTRQRQRACDYPSPQGFGLPCDGPSVDKQCCTGALDLIFSVDRSASIATDEYLSIIGAVDNIIKQLSLDDGSGRGHGYDKVRVGVQTFNDQQQVLKHLNDFITDIGKLTLIAPTGGTDIVASLDQISSVMYTTVNGDRQKPYNENVVVLLTDGHTSGTPMQPANVDRLIVVGIGSSPQGKLSNLASIPGDYMQVNNTCGIISFLQERLLCNDTAVSMNSSLCFNFHERNATATNFKTDFVSL